MKRVMRVMIAGTCLLMLMSLGTGCGASQADFTETKGIHLESARTGKVYVAWSEGYEDGDGFVVTGVVRRADTVGQPIEVQVSAAITSPDGTVLDEVSSDNLRVPRRITSRVQGFQRFKVRFSSVPPAGSSIQLVARSS